jgi:MarR family transcriptional regulator, negative regulator of the multidrug operon emrRAB
MSVDEDSFIANVVGALALTIVDRLQERTVEAARHGPSAPAALITLLFTPDLPMDRLATTLGMTVPGAVQLLNRLQDSGLIVRETGSDRRRRHPRLTDRGERLAREVLDARRAALDEALARLSPAERRQLGQLSERMLAGLSGTRYRADRICRLCDEPTCPDDRCPSELAVPTGERVLTEEIRP